nr:cytochrome d ubiquinol oxidase subunit II [Desulforamulus aquiferis]
MGLFSLAMFTMHGAAFLMVENVGELKAKARGWARNSWLAYVFLFIIATAWSYVSSPGLFVNFFNYPILWIFPLAAVAGMAYFPVALKGQSNSRPVLTSGLSIIGILGIVGGSLFPYLVPASNNPQYGLTIFNSSSSELTLTVMLILALIGMPLVLGYTGYIYYKFLGAQRLPDLESRLQLAVNRVF